MTWELTTLELIPRGELPSRNLSTESGSECSSVNLTQLLKLLKVALEVITTEQQINPESDEYVQQESNHSSVSTSSSISSYSS